MQYGKRREPETGVVRKYSAPARSKQAAIVSPDLAVMGWSSRNSVSGVSIDPTGANISIFRKLELVAKRPKYA
jgi:hypothetical protein